jgi:peptidoglycan/LPS O-acetylase OafA/YrhL
MDAHARFLATRHFTSLDGLRCLSILPVIWHHCSRQPSPGVLGKGPFGVDLFFAISGLLITTLLLRERGSRGTVSMRDFYVRRSLRIFPVYYAVLGLYVLYMGFVFPASPQRTHFLGNLAYFSTYTSNWLVDYGVAHPVTFAFAWSLACEEQFYLSWPWVLRFTRGPWLAAIAMALLLLLDQTAERMWLPGLLPYGSLAARMAASLASPICLGSLLAIALHYRASFRPLAFCLGRRWCAPAMALLLAYVVCADGFQNFTVHVVLALLVVSCTIRADHGLAWLLDRQPLLHVGRVSYGMYLLHVTAVGSLKHLVPPIAEWPVALFLAASLFTVGLATLSHRYFERRFLALSSRFRHSGLGPKAAGDPALLEQPSQLQRTFAADAQM